MEIDLETPDQSDDEVERKTTESTSTPMQQLTMKKKTYFELGDLMAKMEQIYKKNEVQ